MLCLYPALIFRQGARTLICSAPEHQSRPFPLYSHSCRRAPSSSCTSNSSFYVGRTPCFRTGKLYAFEPPWSTNGHFTCADDCPGRAGVLLPFVLWFMGPFRSPPGVFAAMLLTPRELINPSACCLLRIPSISGFEAW